MSSIFKPVRLALTWITVLVALPVLGQFFVSGADELGFYNRPVERIHDFISLIVSHPVFQWCGGAVIGATLVIWCVSVIWSQSADKITDLSGASVPVALKLEFRPLHDTPVQISNSNVYHWTATWNGPSRLGFHGPDGQILESFQHPRVFSLFLLFDKPSSHGQIVVHNSDPEKTKFRVIHHDMFHCVIISEGEKPVGIVDIYSVI